MRDVDRLRQPRVYLAGKIAYGRHWRSSIIYGEHATNRGLAADRPCSFFDIEEALDFKSAIPGEDEGEVRVEIIGSFFVSCDHGCALEIHRRQSRSRAPAMMLATASTRSGN